MSKIIFLKLKIYFNKFLNKKHFKLPPLSQFQPKPGSCTALSGI